MAIQNVLATRMIAGPCALESREQLRSCVSMLKELNINIIRASLWKPRTQPGWEGLGQECLPMLLEETIPHGLMPATEIINAEHALSVVQAMRRYGNNASILVWLGARNQNHLEQQRIARILAEGPKSILFMCKNQMWDDERHWMGIYEHVTMAGFPTERLLLCHRGFSPGKMPNPDNFRNLPDFEMAMRIREKTKVPMILDPSHIGGSRENVFKIVQMSQNYDFDGCIVEVHKDPEQAKTDAKQQLCKDLFTQLLKIVRK